MTDKQILNKLIEIIYSTDADGYPLQAHKKIARLQIFLEKTKLNQAQHGN